MSGDVSEYGGAARRDFVFREEEEKAGEEIVDGDSRAEFLEVGGEGRDRGLALVFGEAGVAGAKCGVDMGDGEAAAPAVGEAIGAASGVVDKAGFSGLLGHFSFLCEMVLGGHPRGNADQCENKGLAGKAIRKNMKTKARPGGQGRQIRGAQRNAPFEDQGKETQNRCRVLKGARGASCGRG